jgi:hypothetical protein
MTDYRKALDTLRGGQVRFIVIGGVAGTAHGSAQLTNDPAIQVRRADDQEGTHFHDRQGFRAARFAR